MKPSAAWRVEDCARVTLSEELTPEDIREKLRIVDCALVVCTQGQEDAVRLIAEDVAMIRVSGREPAGKDGAAAGGRSGVSPEEEKDTLFINAVEYKL